ncbi:MAG: hypothetical protein H0T83_00965 [Chthoniobacterales bacterium]|nr:hypothetical protein [Chthoniobacterales bacterium]
MALNDTTMFAGSDAAAVEAAMKKIAQPAGELEKSAVFREAASKIPAGNSAFSYVDARLLFERADAAWRPLLLMGATFYPALSKSVDVAKLPPPDVIAKHLSPIVMSQRYENGGYITESVGPVTFREATVGLAFTIGGLFLSLKEGGGLLQSLSPSASPPPASPTPTASPF